MHSQPCRLGSDKHVDRHPENLFSQLAVNFFQHSYSPRKTAAAA